MTILDPTPLVGTGLSDQLDGTGQNDQIVGLAGDDSLNGAAGNDILHGDYADENLLDGTDGATGFTDYSESGSWQVSSLDGGHQEMTQSISTEAGGVYELQLDLAANFAAGRPDGAIEVLINDQVIGNFASQSGAYETHAVQFTATDTQTDVTIRSVDAGGTGPEIDTSGPAFHYDKDMEIGGETVTVSAFADGQSNLYQVLNGTLHVFDTETQTYEKAGVDGTVNVNSMGFNAEDDLLYAIAVRDGTDSRGESVKSSDLVMIDAVGKSYVVGDTPYRAWTGDFDDKGNLWSFDSSMNHISVIDVDQKDADGNPVSTVYKLPKDLVEFRVYDVAFDSVTQSFYGVARPKKEGEATELLVVDVSGGDPEFSTIPVTSTVVDGQVLDGAPAMTFGAATIDADGNLFVGGNAGDHDMNDDTPTSGGIYQVIVDEVSGEASLHLIEEAPKSYSNDGAADPTAQSPFADVDLESSVLIRDLELVATTEGELTYDDDINGNAGADTVEGGIGTDTITGGSSGDSLEGNDGNDNLHGGAGENSGSPIISVYDEDGVRYDQFGNVLGEDDDILIGGEGADTLSGSAGHDTLLGGEDADILRGGSGSDDLRGGTGDDTLNGGSEDDRLSGGSGDDLMHGGSGNDDLFGDDGADRLNGGSGHDTLDGGDGADILMGGTQNDALTGGLGEDTLNGGSGNDVLDGSEGADVLKGGSGDDHLTGGTGDDTLDAGSGEDVLTGGQGADVMFGKSGDDTLTGDQDDDKLLGGAGDDDLYGGDGHDKLNGGSGDDMLQGGDGKDLLNGSSGNDTLDGDDGNDRLYMGEGDDIATGGEGADRFIFREQDVDGSTDTITDFSTSEGDKLDFRALDLDEDDADTEAWFDENATVEDDDVFISMDEDTTLVMEDAGSDYDYIYSSILF